MIPFYSSSFFLITRQKIRDFTATLLERGVQRPRSGCPWMESRKWLPDSHSSSHPLQALEPRPPPMAVGCWPGLFRSHRAAAVSSCESAPPPKSGFHKCTAHQLLKTPAASWHVKNASRASSVLMNVLKYSSSTLRSQNRDGGVSVMPTSASMFPNQNIKCHGTKAVMQCPPYCHHLLPVVMG